jgi:uncharacterized cupin superfamily protein
MEARLEEFEAGRAPQSEGWFVLNVADAPWFGNDAFGTRCRFEADGRVVDGSGAEPCMFGEIGYTLAVLEPGRPSGLYHSESNQEDFLVLAGECLLLVDGEERRLRAGDFVHCPPGTDHCFVGGEERAVVFMIGGRTGERRLHYPAADLARRHGAAAEADTDSPQEAYAPRPHWRPRRPEQPPWPES